MPKVHLTALYASLALAIAGLLLAIAALAVLGMNYSEQQARIADLEARDQSLGDLLDGLDAWVEYLHETQQNTKQSIAALDERSEEIADWQNETDVWTEGIVQWQADVASFMHRTRQQGVPAEWATWRGRVDRHIANVLGDVTAIRSGVTRNQSDISSLYDWSDEVTAYLNSGQQQEHRQNWQYWENWEHGRRVLTGELPTLKSSQLE